MAKFEISQPTPVVVRVQFPKKWNAHAESETMFAELLDMLDNAEDAVTLMIVAGDERPVYTAYGLPKARDILFHDNVGKMIIVASNPAPAVSHMSAFRGERGIPPIPIIGCNTEEEAQKHL